MGRQSFTRGIEIEVIDQIGKTPPPARHFKKLLDKKLSLLRRVSVAAALSGEPPPLLEQARDLAVGERSLGSVCHA